MIPALALLVILATDAPGDTLTRVPGSPLRLGWTQERTSLLGSFQQQSSNDDVTVRRGDVRWFGTTSQGTLTYHDGRLAAVRLECTKPTPALLSYVPDELRRAGYRRVSDVVGSGTERSEWTGPGAITLTASAASLVAEVTARNVAPAPDAVNAANAMPHLPAVTAARDTSTSGAAAAGDSGTPGALPGEIDFTATRADTLPAPRVASTPPPPVRPRIAIDAGLFGRVQVRARVDTTGHVVHAEIARGIAEFNSAALAWAADVRFEPYRVNGRPAPVVVLIPVVFAHSDTVRPSP